jgi:hypothetical protein
VREFVTAAEKAETDEGGPEPLVFTLDGEELRAYQPSEGQFALLMMAMGRHTTQTDQFSGILEFFVQVLDRDSEQLVLNRMMRRETTIPMETIADILTWMIEEWGGRPFQKPSASTSSRRTGGRKSTQRTPALT